VRLDDRNREEVEGLFKQLVWGCELSATPPNMQDIDLVVIYREQRSVDPALLAEEKLPNLDSRSLAFRSKAASLRKRG
jgi:hypothetical protein